MDHVEQPVADHAADDADENVDQHAEACAVHDEPGEPARHAADDQAEENAVLQNMHVVNLDER
ncbi:hypothetical protein [Candidatus Burkholderia verschuerenii]|uniref:hypothetical protein n=1 Tax=Candidatus Burkholderia verschuerenii TaxID=242163 RepID=UPI001E4EF0D8|nr:hypothetical protein [Candidatus Burkholderia verschuerenii]